MTVVPADAPADDRGDSVHRPVEEGRHAAGTQSPTALVGGAGLPHRAVKLDGPLGGLTEGHYTASAGILTQLDALAVSSAFWRPP